MKNFNIFISAQNGLTAIFVREGASDTLFHVLSDHLGSVSGVINAKSNEVKYYSYSAWGVPRDAKNKRKNYYICTMLVRAGI